MIGCTILQQRLSIGHGTRLSLDNASNKTYSVRMYGSRVKPGLTGKPTDFVRKFPSTQRTLTERSSQVRQAELDFIDYTTTNGVYHEEPEVIPEVDVEVIPEFEDLDRDVDRLKAKEKEKTRWDFRRVRSLISYLADAKEFGKRGEALMLVIVGAVASVVVPPLAFRGILPFLSIVSILGGIVCTVLGTVSLGSSFSPLPVARKDTPLVQTGIFKFIRHPLYGGLLMLSAGLSVLSGNEFRMLMTGILWFLIEETIRGEEKELEDIHPEYADYRVNVGKLFPHVI
eukprot:g4886.t1